VRAGVGLFRLRARFLLSCVSLALWRALKAGRVPGVRCCINIWKTALQRARCLRRARDAPRAKRAAAFMALQQAKNRVAASRRLAACAQRQLTLLAGCLF
jgi:hypothetical protein